MPKYSSIAIRLCIAKLADSLIINIFLNTLIEHIYWGLDFWAIALSRVITNGIMFVPQVLVGILLFGSLTNAQKEVPIIKRKIITSIILSIFSFGFYYIYWVCLLVTNTRAIKNNKSSYTSEILCLIFVPFYSIYWWYTRGIIVEAYMAKQGFFAKGNRFAYLIFSLLGLEIISAAIMQYDFNSLPSINTQQICEPSNI